MSLRARLTFFYAASVAALLLLLGVLAWWQLGVGLRDALNSQLQARAAEFGSLTSGAGSDGQQGLQEGDVAHPGTFAVVFDAAGALVESSAGAPPGIRPATGDASIGGRAYLLYRAPLATGEVITGASLEPIAATQESLARLLAVLGLLAVAGSLAGGWWLAGRALQPVGVLIDQAATFGPDDLDRRLDEPRRRDELGRLARTLNTMLDRVADGVRRQRAFVAAASHDLRTPITALRAELDLADQADADEAELRQAIRAAHGDAVRLGDLANALLDLASAESGGRTLLRERVATDELLAGVVLRLEPVARLHGSTVELAAPADEVTVDRVRLEHAIGNLVTNAIQYGPAGGTVEIRARVEPSAGVATSPHLVVEVLDRGPGVRRDEVEHLFEPFARGREAGGDGRGLGLATATAAVRAHGGEIGVEPREGGGSCFWISVPAAE